MAWAWRGSIGWLWDRGFYEPVASSGLAQARVESRPTQ